MNNEQALQLLQDVLKVNSTNGNESAVADLIEPILQEAGLETKRYSYKGDRSQLIATLDSGVEGPVLGLTGHMDVVPVGDNPWEHDPFAAEIEDGILYGRGACDMKGGLIALVAAALRLKEENLPKKGKIILVFTADEEMGGKGAKDLVDQDLLPYVDALICAEPTNLQVARAHKGVFWLALETQGRTAHGSTPKKGINAVEKMIKWLDRIAEAYHADDHEDDLLGKSTMSFNQISGGSVVNVVPDRAKAQVDIRTVPGQDHPALYAAFEQIITDLEAEDPDFHGQMDLFTNLYPLRTADQDPLVQIALESSKDILDQPASLAAFSGGTDCAEFIRHQADIPTIIIGPGQSLHEPDEHIKVGDFYQSIAWYQSIIQQWFEEQA
ncbi:MULTISPECIES: M20 family metallopeptidase [unclassified Aerococcus]|uniref:M20 family metallopeptidase n=1 Tax=unclassified Aerococcus TaxID=2618060 RepID=UPI0008A3C2E4|nr:MULTISPECIES: ArgE/DapE family deacylase [unclassified Aerococcus]MDK6368748.1 ArgE/DapE family deacylase [Aerococcus sp. UMB9870]MDK6679296.1 ArgE/DapE family deacylase [Aerococcus sp. UMB8608]MDK6685862.1 ArgE/DapE family deacylase [Aerococcus sp. UMB8623]MDK6939371.1 ArgE/DapE family deacylase [Aerococcus sp. UMB8487]OFK19365.1 hypothetical protein HMPREF2829_01055 [Aerococcus sp. HMSC072A12]